MGAGGLLHQVWTLRTDEGLKIQSVKTVEVQWVRSQWARIWRMEISLGPSKLAFCIGGELWRL